jgi:hypothetical protein
MTRDNAAPRPTADYPPAPSREGWWTRIGRTGRALISLAGLATTGVTGSIGIVVINTGESSGPERPAAVTGAPLPEQSVSAIRFSIYDQLTEGFEEETVLVSLEGTQVASLYATLGQPVASQQVEASEAGNYWYVLDAEMLWRDEAGDPQTMRATGQGSVYIGDGTRLDVYVHDDGDVLTLSLEVAG